MASCVVIEWDDGNVNVTGPYPDFDTATAAAEKTAAQIGVNTKAPVRSDEYQDTPTWIVGTEDHESGPRSTRS